MEFTTSFIIQQSKFTAVCAYKKREKCVWLRLDIGDIIRLTHIRTPSPVLLCPSENMSCNNAVSRLQAPDCSSLPGTRGTLPSECDRLSPLRPAPPVSWAAWAPLTSGDDGKAWPRCLGPDLKCWYRKVILNEDNCSNPSTNIIPELEKLWIFRTFITSR